MHNIFNYLKIDFYTKNFFINKKMRFDDLRGFKNLSVQKWMFFKHEETELGMYSSDLIEGLSGLRPNLLKVVFKIPKKKKKKIIILLRTKLNSIIRMGGIFDTLSVFVLKLSRRVRIKGSYILPWFDIKRQSNYLVVEAGDFPHLLWSNQEMFDYSLKKKSFFDLSLLLTFRFTQKSTISLNQNSFFNLIKTWLKVNL